jgi:hypothetical protein
MTRRRSPSIRFGCEGGSQGDPVTDAASSGRGKNGNKWKHGAPKMGIIVWHNPAQPVDPEDNGEVAERLNAPVLKTGKVSQPS